MEYTIDQLNEIGRKQTEFMQNYIKNNPPAWIQFDFKDGECFVFKITKDIRRIK